MTGRRARQQRDDPAETAAVDASAVDVRRSARRRRTVSAYRDGDRTVVLIPARMSRAEERRWVSVMLERLARQDSKLRPSDAVRRFLEFRGHEVVAAASAEEAMNAAEHFAPQVLLCDWQLNRNSNGGSDGVDVASSLQRRHGLAVIMVTAHRLEALKDKVRRFALDVSAYRRKPVSLASLAEIIESLEPRPGAAHG